MSDLLDLRAPDHLFGQLKSNIFFVLGSRLAIKADWSFSVKAETVELLPLLEPVICLTNSAHNSTIIIALPIVIYTLGQIWKRKLLATVLMTPIDELA